MFYPADGPPSAAAASCTSPVASRRKRRQFKSPGTQQADVTHGAPEEAKSVALLIGTNSDTHAEQAVVEVTQLTAPERTSPKPAATRRRRFKTPDTADGEGEEVRTTAAPALDVAAVHQSEPPHDNISTSREGGGVPATGVSEQSPGAAGTAAHGGGGRRRRRFKEPS